MLFSMGYGFGNGFIFNTVFYISYLYWPNQRVLVTGDLNAFSGVGAGLFTFLAQKYCNPNGENPDPSKNGGKPFSFEGTA